MSEDKRILESLKGLSADSRKIEDGFLFAAFPGASADGRNFIPNAIDAGARFILAPTGTSLPEDCTGVELIEDDNPRLRFAQMAAQFYPNAPEKISAVTGTNGKTSTANFAAQIWQMLGTDSASMGTLGTLTAKRKSKGTLTTLPSEVLHEELNDLAAEGVKRLTLEASSHGLDQYRLHGLKVQAAAFTNLTHDHLDYHADMDEYFAAKSKLFDVLLVDGGCAVINIDDAYGMKLYDKLKTEGRVKVVGIGVHDNADLQIISQEPVATGQRLKVKIFGEVFDINLPLAGVFQAMNVLTAIGLVSSCDPDLNISDIIDVLPRLESVPGRMQSISGHPKGAGVIVDFAHTPDALETVLKAVRLHARGRLVCLFGCGGNRDKAKRPVMGEIAQKYSDHVIVTDDNPRHEEPTEIRADILSAVPDAENIADRRAAILAAVTSLEDGDVLVIAGKGHEQGQIVAGVTFPFDDTEEAQKAIAALKDERSI